MRWYFRMLQDVYGRYMIKPLLACPKTVIPRKIGSPSLLADLGDHSDASVIAPDNLLREHEYMDQIPLAR